MNRPNRPNRPKPSNTNRLWKIDNRPTTVRTVRRASLVRVPAPAKGNAKRRGRKPRRTGHNLLARLQARREDVLRFLADLAVPFTNNQAEQDGRMAKLKQKISGGFRSEQGAHDFAVVRSFISTAKKQGWNVIHSLMLDPETLIERLRVA